MTPRLVKCPRKGAVFHRGLMCFMGHLSYSYENKLGVLSAVDGSHPDMTATVKLFSQLDPTVRRILVACDGLPSVVFDRTATGWVCEPCDPDDDGGGRAVVPSRTRRRATG